MRRGRPEEPTPHGEPEGEPGTRTAEAVQLVNATQTMAVRTQQLEARMASTEKARTELEGRQKLVRRKEARTELEGRQKLVRRKAARTELEGNQKLMRGGAAGRRRMRQAV